MAYLIGLAGDREIARVMDCIDKEDVQEMTLEQIEGLFGKQDEEELDSLNGDKWIMVAVDEDVSQIILDRYS